MNPHLEFGQLPPGADRGRATGIIDTHSLILIPQSVELVADAGALSPAEVTALRRWFEQYLRWLLTSELGIGEALAENNHGTWYRVQVASMARFIGRPDLAQATCILSPPLLTGQLDADDSQPRERRRTRGLFYSLFNLQGWCMLSLLARQSGLAAWDPSTGPGRRLQLAMDHLVPYLLGRPWPHQQIVEMDRRRSASVLCLAAWWWQEPSYARALAQLPSDTADVRGRLLYDVPE